MSRSLRWALLSSAALLSAGSALAADASEDIVITGRFETKETASSVTIITKDDIERRQVATVFEALRGSPGVALTQNGGAGQLTKVRLRGAQGNQVLTLIDGAPVNDPAAAGAGAGFDFAYLDAGSVEQIEILRGAGSAIWGSDAIGGVINIVTIKPGANTVSAYAEGGSFSTGRVGARGTWSAGPLTLSAYATAFKTGGISAAEEHAGNPEKDGASGTTVSLRAATEFGGGLYGQAGLRVTRGEADYDDGFPVQDNLVKTSMTRDVQGDARVGWRSDSKASGVEAMVLTTLAEREYPADFSPYFRGERTQYRLTGDTTFAGSHKALLGYEHEDLEVLAGEDGSDALFATYSGRPLARLLIEGGVRYEDDSQYGASTTGRIAAALDVWAGGALRADYATGFRAPSIDEVLGAGFADPNPNLKPERSNEWEVGLDQSAFGGALTFAIAYFDRDIKDQINYNFPLNIFDNIDHVETRGTEVSAETALGAWTLRGTYSHIEAIDQSTGLQLQRVPQDTASLDADFKATDNWSLGAFVNYNGEERDFPTNPSWTTLDLRTALTLSPHAQIYARIENATDGDYQDVPGYGAPDRAFYAGIRVKK